jgi:hypothetical protein
MYRRIQLKKKNDEKNIRQQKLISKTSQLHGMKSGIRNTKNITSTSIKILRTNYN